MATSGTKGQFVVGALRAKGAVSSGSPGFTTASVAMRVARIPITSLAATEVDTGFDLPVGAIVQNAYLDVNTREQTGSTKTINVGLLSSETAGTATGLLFGVSTASVQVLQPSLVAGSVTCGPLLSEGGAASGRFRKSHVVKGADAVSVSYTLDSAHTELVADIVLEYLAVG